MFKKVKLRENGYNLRQKLWFRSKRLEKCIYGNRIERNRVVENREVDYKIGGKEEKLFNRIKFVEVLILIVIFN